MIRRDFLKNASLVIVGTALAAKGTTRRLRFDSLPAPERHTRPIFTGTGFHEAAEGRWMFVNQRLRDMSVRKKDGFVRARLDWWNPDTKSWEPRRYWWSENEEGPIMLVVVGCHIESPSSHSAVFVDPPFPYRIGHWRTVHP